MRFYKTSHPLIVLDSASNVVEVIEMSQGWYENAVFEILTPDVHQVVTKWTDVEEGERK